MSDTWLDILTKAVGDLPPLERDTFLEYLQIAYLKKLVEKLSADQIKRLLASFGITVDG